MGYKNKGEPGGTDHRISRQRSDNSIRGKENHGFTDGEKAGWNTALDDLVSGSEATGIQKRRNHVTLLKRLPLPSHFPVSVHLPPVIGMIKL